MAPGSSQHRRQQARRGCVGAHPLEREQTCARWRRQQPAAARALHTTGLGHAWAGTQICARLAPGRPGALSRRRSTTGWCRLCSRPTCLHLPNQVDKGVASLAQLAHHPQAAGAQLVLLADGRRACRAAARAQVAHPLAHAVPAACMRQGSAAVGRASTAAAGGLIREERGRGGR